MSERSFFIFRRPLSAETTVFIAFSVDFAVKKQRRNSGNNSRETARLTAGTVAARRLSGLAVASSTPADRPEKPSLVLPAPAGKQQAVVLLLCICLAVILRNPFGALAQQAYPACHLEQNVYKFQLGCS
jgi:hypothetical protein